ncbi:MAG: anaerobic sulfatase maturase [Solirubrobacteraceae bacterium]
MAKPTGALCNLECRYCYFLAKKALYPGSRFRMSARVAESYIRQLLAANRHESEIVIAWQGGEPTIIGLEFFRRAIELERRYARPGQRILNTLQTNGTLLDDEWCGFLAAHEFLVGISIDGPRGLHDAYRVGKGGRPTFDRVLRGLQRLRRHGVDWNVLATVHAANGDSGRSVYRFLRDELDARFIQFIPIVERSAGQGDLAVSERSVRPEQFGMFLIDVFEEWVRRDVGVVYVQAFDTALAHWVGLPGGLCVHEETCGSQAVLEHTGDLYSCDHYVEPRFLLGNIEQVDMGELMRSAAQLRFGAAKRDALTQYCRDCPVRFACNGGCPKDRFVRSPQGEAGHSYLCRGYEAFFAHIDGPMTRMAAMISVGRAPADIMRELGAPRAAEL